MEYLMTYGWAILVVAIVVVAIFSLGLFNPSNLGPKARAGSCQIYRPEGIWTAAFINLEGTCNNAVPEFVAQFNGGSYILISNPDLFDSGTFTVTAWVNINNPSTFHTLIGREMSTQGWNFLLSSSGALGLRIDTNTITNYALYPPTPTLNDNKWHFIAAVVNLSTAQYLYQDGILTASSSSNIGSFTQTGGTLNLMYSGQGTGCCTQGEMADVQIYNTTLSHNDIVSLYDEGIGGVPLALNHLTLWLPLNGNPIDYSGNIDSGTDYGDYYNTFWTNGYTIP